MCSDTELWSSSLPLQLPAIIAAGNANEHDHTTRFYNAVKAEGRMHYSRILPNLYVGSCHRQLKHIRQLSQDLKVTAVFNLQTAEDIK